MCACHGPSKMTPKRLSLVFVWYSKEHFGHECQAYIRMWNHVADMAKRTESIHQQNCRFVALRSFKKNRGAAELQCHPCSKNCIFISKQKLRSVWTLFHHIDFDRWKTQRKTILDMISHGKKYKHGKKFKQTPLLLATFEVNSVFYYRWMFG